VSVRVSFDETGRECLRTTEQRYPYAYGYLAGQVRDYLNGNTTEQRLEAVLEALNAALRGERP
jgi:hypothetical protein